MQTLIDVTCYQCGNVFQKNAQRYNESEKLHQKHFCSRKCCHYFRKGKVFTDRGTPVERFWKYVDRRSPEECWNWKGTSSGSGYGIIRVNNKNIGAHRMAWMIIRCATIPEGIFICHKCDNRLCCNPDHLFIGTNDDNVKDMVSKKRHAIGTKNGHSKISFQISEEIRRIYKAGTLSQKKLGSMFGITASVVSEIINFKTWTEEQSL